MKFEINNLVPYSGKPKQDVAETSEKAIEFLAHHGVKGQKWGVRRKSKMVSKSSIPNIKSLSDEELRARVNRMQLEKQFNDLSTSSNRSFGSSGKKFAKEIIKDVGKQQTKRLVVEATTAIAAGALVAIKMSRA